MNNIKQYITEKLHLTKDIGQDNKEKLKLELWDLLKKYVDNHNRFIIMDEAPVELYNAYEIEIESLTYGEKRGKFIAYIYHAFKEEEIAEDFDFEYVSEDIIKKLIEYIKTLL